MKILVPVKRVVDFNVKVRVKSDGSGVDLANVKMSMNPFDEIAVEEAVRIKERGEANEVVAVSIGGAKAADTLRTALAMGADRAILVKTEAIDRAARRRQAPQARGGEREARSRHHGQAGHRRRLQSIGPDAGRPARLAARNLRLQDRAQRRPRSGSCARWMAGLETLVLARPAVLTTDLRLNEPRYASLPNIMKAKKKTIDETSARNARRRCRAAAEGDLASPSPRRARPGSRSTAWRRWSTS